MTILRKVAWFVIASCRSLVQIHPPLTFSDYFAQCICPKRCVAFFSENAKTGLEAVMSTVSKPVFSDVTVFWAVFTLKTRKLPDLSGRQIRQSIWQRKKDSNPHKRSQSPVCYHYTIPLRTNDIIQIFWDLSTLLPHIFHEMKNTPVGPARTRRQGREKRTQRSRILPSIEIVTTCHGRNFPLARSASRAACSSPPQHGTSMRTMVTL